MSKQSAFFCSFCGKAQQETRVLISGPNVFICDECIELCVMVLRDGDAGYGCKAAFAGVMDAVETEVRWAARCGDIEGVEI